MSETIKKLPPSRLPVQPLLSIATHHMRARAAGMNGGLIYLDMHRRPLCGPDGAWTHNDPTPARSQRAG